MAALRRFVLLCRLLLQGKLLTIVELLRLSRLPRYAPTSTRILGHKFIIPDPHSFIAMYIDIFENEIYRFETDRRWPLIIDCGANIGMSVLYFKRLMPDARIVAFEPDSALADVLHANLEAFGIRDVRIVKAALADQEGYIEFLTEGADAGRIAQPEDPGEIVRVPAVRLGDHLGEPVALLKIDIEGAETDLLRDCASHLGQVERIFVEYHSFTALSQRLDELLLILKEAGFRYQILPAGVPPTRPFTRQQPIFEMDLQLNIFADRPGAASDVSAQILASTPTASGGGCSQLIRPVA